MPSGPIGSFEIPVNVSDATDLANCPPSFPGGAVVFRTDTKSAWRYYPTGTTPPVGPATVPAKGGGVWSEEVSSASGTPPHLIEVGDWKGTITFGHSGADFALQGDWNEANCGPVAAEEHDAILLVAGAVEGEAFEGCNTSATAPIRWFDESGDLLAIQVEANPADEGVPFEPSYVKFVFRTATGKWQQWTEAPRQRDLPVLDVIVAENSTAGTTNILRAPYLVNPPAIDIAQVGITALASDSTGSPNNIGSSYATTGGGDQLNIGTGSTGATLSGGRQISIGDDSPDASVGGGFNNVIGDDAAGSRIAGGSNNAISDGADHANIDGGDSNSVTQPGGSVGGGTSNNVQGTNGRVGGGTGNLASGENATVPGGNNNAAAGDNSHVSGSSGLATNFGERVHGGNGNAQGDFQDGMVMMQGETSGAGANQSVILSVDGLGTALTLRLGCAYNIDVQWAAFRTDAAASESGRVVGSARIAGGGLVLLGQAQPGDEQFCDAGINPGDNTNGITLSAPGPAGELRLTFRTGTAITAAMKVGARVSLVQIAAAN